MDWKRHVELAQHHLALGQTTIHLDQKDQKPWQFVTEASTGGTIRYGVSVTIYLKAVHESGLTFSWIMDLEIRDALAEPGLSPDVIGVTKAIQMMPKKPASQMAAAIREFAKKCKEQSRDYSAAAGQQMEAAAHFERLADMAAESVKVAC